MGEPSPRVPRTPEPGRRRGRRDPSWISVKESRPHNTWHDPAFSGRRGSLPYINPRWQVQEPAPCSSGAKFPKTAFWAGSSFSRKRTKLGRPQPPLSSHPLGSQAHLPGPCSTPGPGLGGPSHPRPNANNQPAQVARQDPHSPGTGDPAMSSTCSSFPLSLSRLPTSERPVYVRPEEPAGRKTLRVRSP